MTFEKEDLEKILPHRNKMVLLTRVPEFDIERGIIKTEYNVTPDCIFYEEGRGMPDWATFEVMAQSISALTGITDLLNGHPQRAGCLLSVAGFKSSRDYFTSGSTLCVTAVEEYKDLESSIYRYNCTLTLKGEEEPCTSSVVTVMQVTDMASLVRD